ncbi:hypothetical protein P0M11_10970 [Kaistella sp. PBT33-4]|uniref:hypothetical protein n=1 Tax=Kaistella sp. PBT33-4 TaxID=3032000 RepID=UPI0023D89B12|nr:hypothetical protein [Kaistella sp. PBT33-4]MDF0720519.1 hypothetical protein [Kaistella sp. PBT33-4]
MSDFRFQSQEPRARNQEAGFGILNYESWIFPVYAVSSLCALWLNKSEDFEFWILNFEFLQGQISEPRMKNQEAGFGILNYESWIFPCVRCKFSVCSVVK